jgi:L-asparaginase II
VARHDAQQDRGGHSKVEFLVAARPMPAGSEPFMMQSMPGATGYAELATIERSGFIESRHFGSLVALDHTGSTAIALGGADAAMLPRSTVKPLQAVALLTAGATLDARQLAVASASHTGEDAHVDAARSILAAARLDDSALQCPVDRPSDRATHERLIRAGEPRSSVRMNCSGKHAAMLLTCVENGWSTADYLDPGHPLQQHIRSTMAEFTGVDVAHTAIDGCGAPLFSTSVRGVATAFRRLVTAEPGSAARTVADAMRQHPYLVGGGGNPNTSLMELLPGVVAKGGAEGVIGVATAEGHAVAMKIIDGSARATTLVALHALRMLGVDVAAADELLDVPVLGGGEPVGAIRPGADLDSAVAEG